MRSIPTNSERQNGDNVESIKINCEGSRTVPLGSLKPFQGNLKNLSESAYVKLRGLIQTMGFSFPFFVWNDTENNQTYILDGHQRVRTLQKMASEGFDIPDLPVADVNAANYRDAKKKLMAAASQFGDIDKQGLYEFMSENDWEFDFLAENFKLPEINFDDFKNEFISTPDFEPGSEDDQSKLDKHKLITCPNCGNEFEKQS